ncbi:hypothetical protein [Halalkalibacter hemicellulosilyticus]|uniref:hypothetical protein n=1 Tax=Halalkalibacter hemicellulosilyticus TaxID=127886 RepID=UPI000A5D5308|nr:hypothetical protein [Halalkalibacter hemicellulosilyticus]
MPGNKPIIVQPSQETCDWIRWYFERTTIPRMSQEKIQRILADHEQKQKAKKNKETG